ncbi:ABC transporter ATP-binding protein [Gallaecimonas mangrovi]|uniref:ABC transporter ATP-binding protein n=1 Tax=Gallaecimonas mangrovi TaxID=2291597 RepID=UPI000E201860|nr:polyamine ABC transporter ATP-binding protein [Gallaecimonas mangrovi]
MPNNGSGVLLKQQQQSQTPRQTLVSIKGLSKRFGATLAVDNVDLDIHKGELFALLGGSGSGKTTLLRMLAGFETPSKGSITIDGEDITDMPPHQRPINMMFQSYALFPHMTVAQNIAYGLKRDSLPRSAIDERVQEMLRLVRMSDFGKRKPHQLSGGQRQRVALARSLAKRPKLLLLDEPMGALDKKLRTEMQLEVVEILEQVGVTCVMVTHDQEEAMTMAGRIAIMNDGWIVQQGTPLDIYESPNCRMTAEFIGSVNIFEGEIIADEPDHALIASPALDSPVYLGYGITTSVEEKRVWVAVRPEKAIVSRDKPSQEQNWAFGRIHDIAYLGPHSVYYIKLNSGQVVQSQYTNLSRRGDRLTWDDPVYVYWDAVSAIVLRS